jgi:hypothetical protein
MDEEQMSIANKLITNIRAECISCGRVRSWAINKHSERNIEEAFNIMIDRMAEYLHKAGWRCRTLELNTIELLCNGCVIGKGLEEKQ